jgi:ATP-dependent DNA ligase
MAVPRFITLRADGPPRAPSDPDWAHEIKWDDWRLQAHKRADGVTLYSRPGNDLTARFPPMAEAIVDLATAITGDRW